jgi:hypothetical protein
MIVTNLKFPLVVKAFNLLKCNNNQLPNAYASISVGGRFVSETRRMEGSDPEWNDSFEMCGDNLLKVSH